MFGIVGPRQANLVLIVYASSESSETFRQKARSLAPLNGWACAVKICHDGMLEDTNSLDGAHTFNASALLSSVKNKLKERFVSFWKKRLSTEEGTKKKNTNL